MSEENGVMEAELLMAPRMVTIEHDRENRGIVRAVFFACNAEGVSGTVTLDSPCSAFGPVSPGERFWVKLEIRKMSPDESFPVCEMSGNQ
jgi:hypothetical protein